MNKRFRELAFQAMSINQKVSDDSFFVEVSKLNEFEKFAELIVLECADLVEGFEMTQQFAPDVIMNFEASSVLKEQFGVKE